MSKITQKMLVVLIVRSENEKTPVTVFPHEVPILEYIHGDDAVQVTDATPPVATGSFDAKEEFARLQQRYVGNIGQNPTVEVYGSEKEFVAAFKKSSEFTEDEEVIHVASEDEPDNDPDFSGEGSDEDAYKEGLIEDAKKLGIKANGTWGVAKLEEAIAEAKKGK